MCSSDTLFTKMPQMIRYTANVAGASPILNADQRRQIRKPRTYHDGIEGDPCQWLDDSSAIQRTAVAVAIGIHVDIYFDLLLGIEKRHHHMCEMTRRHNPSTLNKLLVVAPKPVGQYRCVEPWKIVQRTEKTQMRRCHRYPPQN
jgi:hypothetical protein